MLWLVADKYQETVLLYKNKPTVRFENPDKPPYEKEYKDFQTIYIDEEEQWSFCLENFEIATGLKLAHGKPMKLKLTLLEPNETFVKKVNGKNAY